MNSRYLLITARLINRIHEKWTREQIDVWCKLCTIGPIHEISLLGVSGVSRREWVAAAIEELKERRRA